MGDLHKLNTSKPRKLSETEWSEGGLRLSPARKVIDTDWFVPAIVGLPLGVFLIVYFW
jgi:hypothetical protein